MSAVRGRGLTRDATPIAVIAMAAAAAAAPTTSTMMRRVPFEGSSRAGAGAVDPGLVHLDIERPFGIMAR